MPTYIHRQVERARRGELPTLVGRLPSGWLVVGDKQVVNGYCLLLPDPVVAHLNDFAGEARERFLCDMAAAGDALLTVTGAVRINYEMLGNLEPALHAHLFPRYRDEPETNRTKPIWFYDWESARLFDAKFDRAFMDRLRAELNRRNLLVEPPG